MPANAATTKSPRPGSTKLTAAIRKQDSKTLITVGVIPWPDLAGGQADLLLAGGRASTSTSSASTFTRARAKLDKAINAIATYEFDKPIVIEETFPLSCSMEEMKTFVDRRPGCADGWISHYFGHTMEEHEKGAEPAGKITAGFLEYWRERGKAMQRAAANEK